MEDTSDGLFYYDFVITSYANICDTSDTICTVELDIDNSNVDPELLSQWHGVEIYRDHVLYEAVVLDESNDWKYEWESDEVHEWNCYIPEMPENTAISLDSVISGNDTTFVFEEHIWEE